MTIDPLHPGLCDISNNINLDNINREFKKTMVINSDFSEPDSSKLVTTNTITWTRHVSSHKTISSPRGANYSIAQSHALNSQKSTHF